MDFNIIPDQDALSSCAWCGARIAEDAEVVALDCRFAPDVDMSTYESHCIELEFDSGEKFVDMLVTAQGSDARAQGKEGLFLLCSDACAQKLKHALKNDTSVGKLFKDFD